MSTYISIRQTTFRRVIMAGRCVIIANLLRCYRIRAWSCTSVHSLRPHPRCLAFYPFWRTFEGENQMCILTHRLQNFPHPTPFFGFNTSCFWRWNVLYLYRDMGGASAPPFFRHFPFKIGGFRSASGKNSPSSNFSLPSSNLNLRKAKENYAPRRQNWEAESVLIS